MERPLLTMAPMKKALASSLCALLLCLSAKATTYTFTPTPGNLGNLDHNLFYTWGLSWQVPAGEVITGATLSFSKIWDWRVETDNLFIHLLDTAPLGVNSWTDDEDGTDFFASSTFASYGIAHTKIGQWSDPYGGDPSKAQNVSFVFNSAQLMALQGYISNATPSGWARFAFGFDPECHYYNDGITFTINTVKAGVPETGATLVLLLMAVGGMVLVRHRLLAKS